jgi:hypothetical protein
MENNHVTLRIESEEILTNKRRGGPIVFGNQRPKDKNIKQEKVLKYADLNDHESESSAKTYFDNKTEYSLYLK